MKLTEVLLNRKRTEGPRDDGVESWSEKVQAVPIHLISAGKYQPRQEFDQEALDEPVSYTHLDVYKRQAYANIKSRMYLGTPLAHYNAPC